MATRRVLALASVGSLALILVGAPARGHVSLERTKTKTTPPNIVFILTDDQRPDTMWALPQINSDLVDHGVTFSNSFVSDPLCCPSRASILTGTYSHTNQVYNNGLPGGGFQKFDDHTTIATWLHDAA